jgi:ankyrin repeat protein
VFAYPNDIDMDKAQKTTWSWIIGAGAVLIVLLPLAIGVTSSGDDLAHAVQESNIADVKELLENGADPNTRLTHSWRWRLDSANKGEIDDQLTLLMFATKNDRTPIVKLLLDHNADLELRDTHDGWTALEWAAATGCTDIERMLLDHGARIDETDASRYNAVTIAAAFGNFPNLKMLVERGARLNTPPNKYGDTPLIAAVRTGNKEMIAYLRKHHSS